MLLSKCLESYLDDCYGLAEGTRDLYRSHLERFMVAVGDVEVEGVTSGVVRRYLGGLRRKDGKPYSASYVDQVYRTLNTFFRWAVAERRLEVNPLQRVRRPRVPRRKSPRLTLPEVVRVLEAVRATSHPARNVAMVCLAVDSGLRRAEVLELELGNVDLDRGVVLVTGKGGRDREVPIGPVTVEALGRYLAVRPVCNSGRVFVSSQGKALAMDAMQSMMYRLKKRAGLPGLRWHLLRHTFANVWLYGGGGLRQLQEILGHADVRTTAAIYTDPDLALLKQCHERASPLSILNNHKEDAG